MKANLAVGFAIAAVAIAIGPWVGDRWTAWASRFSENPLTPNYVQLAASPRKFDGALVFLTGYCVNKFEHAAVYGTEDLVEWSPSFWLELSESQSHDFGDGPPRKCRVMGVFRAGPSGHASRWAGSVDPVVEISAYPD